MKKLILTTLAAVALIVAGNAAIDSARAQYKAPAAAHDRWEYGLLSIGNGNPVFTTAKEQATATPPGDPSGNSRSATGQFPDRVNLVTRDLWNADVMTMNALGAEGWEAVSMLSVDARGTAILMRRRI